MNYKQIVDAQIKRVNGAKPKLLHFHVILMHPTFWNRLKKEVDTDCREIDGKLFYILPTKVKGVVDEYSVRRTRDVFDIYDVTVL